MKVKKYAGIGSRSTPKPVLDSMQYLAKIFDKIYGYELVTGDALGADRAFMSGTNNYKLYLKENCTPKSRLIAAAFHPYWHNCGELVRQFLGRNAHIILGDDLLTPVDFVTFWSDNENRGGTSLGVKIARAYGIPVYNLKDHSVSDIVDMVQAIVTIKYKVYNK